MKESKSGSNHYLLTCVLLIFISGCSELKAQDQITLANSSGNEIGLLVDGALNGSSVNDTTYVSADGPALIGQFSLAGRKATNEIMAFTQDRPMAIRTSVPWTAGNDNVTMAFANKILIPVTMWILYVNTDTTYDAVVAKAMSDLMTCSTIYSKERVGVDFSTVTVKDATANPMASKYYDYQSSSMQTSIKKDIGYVTGQINIYYVRYLNWGTLYGNAGEAGRVGGPSVVVGSGTNIPILAHEIGHLLALWHVHTGAPTQWFDRTNIMSTNGSSKAQFFTEGQVLRMHLSSNSILNSDFSYLRPGLPIRDCDPTTTTKITSTCPGVQKRVWADGDYPAN